MTNKDLIKLGFKPVEHFTFGNNVSYDLGRDRILSASGIGTPNEFVYICQFELENLTDLICVHNYDYNGYLTEDKVINLIKCLK